MGKKLRTAIDTILNSLGNYAFPNGKPQIDWGGGNPPVIPPCTVSKTIGTGLSSTGGDSDVAFGDPLEVSIAITDNLYIIDDDSVTVTMGGSPVAGAWNASTMKVTIAAVTGNVVINVPSLTYVLPSNLAFHLDCKNRGNQNGHWIDLVDGVDFKLTDVTEADSGMVFNGTTSKGVVMDDNDPTQMAIGTKSINVDYKDGTLEIIAVADALPSVSGESMPILINPREKGIMSHFSIGTAGSYNGKLIMCIGMTVGGTTGGHYSLYYNAGTNIEIAVNTNEFSGDIVRFNGVTKSATWYDTWIGGNTQSTLSVGYRYRNNSGSITEQFFKGTIKAIRVYNTKLNEQQMIQNYKVDKKRFNLA